MTVTSDPELYDAYNKLCERFREFHEDIKKSKLEIPWLIKLTKEDARLIWLALTASKAQLVRYDPKKGLNQ